MGRINTFYRFTTMTVSSQFPESHTIHKWWTTHCTESGFNAHRKFLRARCGVGLLPPVLVMRLCPRRDNYGAVEKQNDWQQLCPPSEKEADLHSHHLGNTKSEDYFSHVYIRCSTGKFLLYISQLWKLGSRYSVRHDTLTLQQGRLGTSHQQHRGLST